MIKRHKYDIIVILAVLALGVSLYLTITKYAGIAVPCSVTHGCETVLHSKYSSFLGFPLSLWGVLYFSGVIVAGLLANHYQTWRKLVSILLGIGALGAFAFLFLQFFVIKQVCQYCLITDLLGIFMFIWDLNVEADKQ